MTPPWSLLSAIARDGVVASSALGHHGLDARDIAHLRRVSSIFPLIRGWYAVGSPNTSQPPWEQSTPWATERAHHRLRTIATVQSFGGRALAAAQSALILEDAPLHEADLSVIHVQFDHATGHGRGGKALHVHAAQPPVPGLPPVQLSQTLRLVHPAIACVQVGLTPHGGMRHPLETLVSADGLLRAGRLTADQLQAAVTSMDRTHGIRAVRTLAGFADGRHESVGETRTAHVLRLLGYTFEPQLWVDLPSGPARLDFGLVGEPVAIEFDGLGKYEVDAAAGQPWQARARLRAEKVREDDLRRLGWGVARPVWDDLDRPEAVRAKVEAAREQARRWARGA